MEKRNDVTTILRSNNPDKLIVFRASSLEDQIRFYINDTKYIVAIEVENGLIVKFDEEKEEVPQKDSNQIIEENLKEFIKLLSISCAIVILNIIALVYLAIILRNFWLILCIISVFCFIIKVTLEVVFEALQTSPNVRSKHAAEHMIVNFMKKNKRLPNTIREVKKSSRFSTSCGSVELIKGFSEELLQRLISIFCMGCNFYIVNLFLDSSLVNVIVLIGSYFGISFLLKEKIMKRGKLSFIIIPMQKTLTKVVQLANTTSRVKDNDIRLAYFVAWEWLKIVYPQFYKEPDRNNEFCQNFKEVNEKNQNLDSKK